MKLLKKIWRLIAVNWSVSFQYRGDLLLWTIAEAATPLISLAVWYSVASNSNRGLSPTETLTYYILIMFVVTLTSAWGGYHYGTEILQGDIVKHLIKPISPLWAMITNNVVEKAMRLVVPVPLFILALWLWPHAFTPSIFEAQRWLWFVLSIFLAASLAFAIDMMFAFFAFWLEDAVQIRWYKDTLQMITSGILIPIAFMPSAIQRVVNVLPFRHIITTPIDILLGHTNTHDILHLITIQAIWAICASVALAVLWKRGLKRYAPPGQ